MSLSGRLSHLASTRVPGVVNWFTRRQAGQFERSGGTKGATLAGRPIFRLTVAGRSSGEPRSVMVMLVRRGDDLLVCGSQAGSPQAPNWWKNLMAAGRATAQVGDETYQVDARELTDPDERAAAWPLLTAAYPDFETYAQLTDRVLPVAVLTRSR